LHLPAFSVINNSPLTRHGPKVLNLNFAVEFVATTFDISIRLETGTELASHVTVGFVT